jgi:hypothetical protein
MFDKDQKNYLNNEEKKELENALKNVRNLFLIYLLFRVLNRNLCGILKNLEIVDLTEYFKKEGL